MKTVDRYRWTSSHMLEHDRGSWVAYSDLERAHEDVERLKRKVCELEKELGRRHDAYELNREKPSTNQRRPNE